MSDRVCAWTKTRNSNFPYPRSTICQCQRTTQVLQRMGHPIQYPWQIHRIMVYIYIYIYICTYYFHIKIKHSCRIHMPFPLIQFHIRNPTSTAATPHHPIDVCRPPVAMDWSPNCPWLHPSVQVSSPTISDCRHGGVWGALSWSLPLWKWKKPVVK